MVLYINSRQFKICPLSFEGKTNVRLERSIEWLTYGEQVGSLDNIQLLSELNIFFKQL